MNWLARLLTPFADERHRTGWRGAVLFVLLTLAPVAYLAAIILGSRLETGGVKFLPPAQAIERARQAARDMGVDVTGWREVLVARFNGDLNAYFDDPRYQTLPPEQKRFASFAAAQVTFAQPAQGHWVQVKLRPDGSWLSVRLAPSLEPNPRRITEEEAREIATRELQRLLAPAASLGLREPELLAGEATEVRRFRWEADFRGLPEFRGTFTVDVRGDRVVSAGENFSIQEAAVAARTSGWARTGQTLRATLLLLLVCYALYRFARRSLEREVALVRCAILFGGMLVLNLVLLVIHPGRTIAQVDPERLGTSLVLLLLGVLVGALVSAIVLALSYGGAEGELREIYPGKLTSLDALLTGRWYSANVGSSVIFGIAVAGWMLLANMLGERLFSSRIPRFATADAALSYVTHGWLALLAQQPLQSIFACTFGLVLPLMFANRHVADRRARRALVIVLGLAGGSLGVDSLDLQLPWMLVRVVAVGALMLAAFWANDFLAAVVATNLFLVGHSVATLAPLGGDWLGVLRYVVGFTIFTGVIALAAVYRGPHLTDDLVRPKYAERLQERLGLQAEVSAAREAQLRLLPTELPQVPGLRLAASCTPAREVGGDFYDFFPLARGGLGVLVAEGGSAGLASALTIGLAKGFLLYAAERAWTPGEALRHLRPLLVRAVKGNIDRLGLAYLVLHADGHARVARFGAYPKLVELTPGGAPREIELLGLAEEDFVGERSWNLSPGSTLLLATDGLFERLRQRSGRDLTAWLLERPLTGTENLHALLQRELATQASELDDDLTLVVVERLPVATSLREGVA